MNDSQPDDLTRRAFLSQTSRNLLAAGCHRPSSRHELRRRLDERQSGAKVLVLIGRVSIDR